MNIPAPADRYRNNLLALIAVLLSVGALRASYAVMMPILFAGVIVAALWPLKLWLQRFLPSWLSCGLTVLALIAVLGGFAAAVYLSLGQVVGVLAEKWPAIEKAYTSAAERMSAWGIQFNAGVARSRLVATIEMLASSVYGFATYLGFIGLLVILGLPEVPRLHEKLGAGLDAAARSQLLGTMVEMSEQVRGYFGVTLATSLLTGIASAAWALVTGLDLVLVWGLLNFLLNFIPVVGNIIGIIPPVLYAFVQFDGIGMPLLILGGFAVLQITISNFVYPILQGRRLSLSPLAIIVAMTFWSWLWGIAGALIAVPLTAGVVIVCGHFRRTEWIARLLSA
jgi:AI-2 transport protein TqsA